MFGRRPLPWSLVLLVMWIGSCCGRVRRPESDAKRLYDDRLRVSGYNKLIRPVGNTSDTLTVRIGLRLTQIIDVVSIVVFVSVNPLTPTVATWVQL